MKRYLLFIGLICNAAILIAQAPQSFNYQSILYDTDGAPISGDKAYQQLSILKKSKAETFVSTEIQADLSNIYERMPQSIGSRTAITCPDNFSVCLDEEPFMLYGGLPEGGVYSGPGVSGGMFYPVMAFVGTHTITYTYTYPNLISDFCTFEITVNPLPVVICPDSYSVCIEMEPFELTGGMPLGGVYDGDGVMGEMFSPEAAGSGDHIIIYVYTDENACTNFCTFTIHVYDLFEASIAADQMICFDSVPEVLTSTVTGGAGDYNYQWWNYDEEPVEPIIGATEATYQPPALMETTSYVLQVFDDCGMIISDPVTITVIQSPTVNAGEDDEINAGQSYILNGSAANYSSVLWTTAGDGVFDNATTLNATYTPGEDDLAEGSVILTLTATGNGPCPAISSNMTLTITSALCGDVNEDGVINVLDIITMVNHIMGGNPNPFNIDAADINADGGINVLDIIALVNIIMQVPGIPCPCLPSVTYEGQTYHTVQIDDQCWLKENLNVGTKINSTTNGFQQTDNGTIEKYCYDNNEANCAIYGGLYEWPEAMQYVTTEGAQGICPAGWHIPADGEYTALNDYLGGTSVAGGKIKSTGTIEEGTGLWHTPNTDATNESGFTALPGGASYFFGNFDGLGYDVGFWSSSHFDTYTAWGRDLYTYDASFSRGNYLKEIGCSMRCLKSCWPQPTQSNAGPDQVNIQGISTTLAGNTPASGTGLWAIVNGTGGTIVNPTSPTSEFQGVAGNTYFLTWTINTICNSSVDTVKISFIIGIICPDIPIVIYEGQTYNTVLIGDQCWLRENLNVGTLIDGNTNQTNNGTIEKYCYSNNASNCITYGGLYQWNEAMQYVTTEGAQGICPVGWHIPTDEEWTILTDFLGSDVAGGKMKSTGTIEEGTGLWHEPNTGATNESGFTALPGGNGTVEFGFNNLYYSSSIWSSSIYIYNLEDAWNQQLVFIYASVLRECRALEAGFSIRCLKD